LIDATAQSVEVTHEEPQRPIDSAVLLAALPLFACGNAASAASAEDPPSPTSASTGNGTW
jgi:hypothetical protein